MDPYISESDLLFYGKFRTYKRAKGETLQSISEKLGIDARELRRYHNIHCLLSDLIERDFKHYTRFLILEPEKNEADLREEKVIKPKKINLGDDNRLYFHPGRIQRKYSVEYIFESGGKIDTMGMAVKIKWLATDINKYHLFEIRRSMNLFVNDTAPDRIMDELGAKIVEVLFPLKIVVDEFGKWVAIYNHEEIVSRWGNKKNEIFKYYEKDAKVTQQLITFTDYALTDSDTLFEFLESDYFLRSFFSGIHINHTADYATENEISFPADGNKESNFHIYQKIATHLDESGLIKVEQNGEYVNSNNHFNLGNRSFNGNYNASYFLNPDSYFIEKMNLECNVDFNKVMKLNINIESIEN